MAIVVYLLCALLSMACATLLYRSYLDNKFRLLFWCAVGFCGFAINNCLILVDIFIGPNYDLSTLRTMPSLIGMILMTYGLIMESV